MATAHSTSVQHRQQTRLGRVTGRRREASIIDRDTQRDQLVGGAAPLLTTRQAAAYLGRKPAAISRLIREFGLPFRRVGRLLAFDQHELEQWTTAHRQGEPQDARHEPERMRARILARWGK